MSGITVLIIYIYSFSTFIPVLISYVALLCTIFINKKKYLFVRCPSAKRETVWIHFSKTNLYVEHFATMTDAQRVGKLDSTVTAATDKERTVLFQQQISVICWVIAILFIPTHAFTWIPSKRNIIKVTLKEIINSTRNGSESKLKVRTHTYAAWAWQRCALLPCALLLVAYPSYWDNIQERVCF